MKSNFEHLLLLVFLLFGNKIAYSQKTTNTVYSSCVQGSANSMKTLDINNIEAAVLTCGDMHWDLNSTFRYRFPKGTTNYCSGPAGLWIGGFFGTSLVTACQTYRQNGTDFWPGPLDSVVANIDATTCYAYDRIWKIDYTSINDFITHFNNGTIQNGTYPINPAIQTWPIGTQYKLAPFVDVNNNGIYDPKVGGDYPEIKGDQSLFYVFNDKGNSHTNTGSINAMGIQINAMPYAYGCSTIVATRPELMNTTFYDYKIINHSPNTYTNTYIGIWVDASIGDETNDFVGTNPKLGYMYAYNGTPTDNVYGQYSPAVGTVMLKAPLVGKNDGIDNDLDTIIDEINESYLIPNMYYFQSTKIVSPLPDTSGQGDPTNQMDYYRYLTGRWKTDSSFVCGGIAYPYTSTGNPVKHVFPGINTIDPLCNTNWTEITAGNAPGNRSYLLSMGPFTFKAKDTTEIEFAFVTSIDSTQPGNNWANVLKLEADIKKVKTFYNTPNKPNCIDSISVTNKLTEVANNISIYPNPNDKILFINSTFKNDCFVRVIDLLGQEVISEFALKQGVNIIDIQSFSSGVYFLQETSSLKNHKIIKR